jgi:zinc transporter 5/7
MLAHDFLKKDDRNFVPTSSTKDAWYFLLLVLSKFARCVGIFFVDTLAKEVHVVGLLWLMKFIASAILLPTQKPFSSGKSLRKSLHVRIGQLALFNCLIEILWFYGITFCGPLRSILVFEQNTEVVLIALMALVKGSDTPAKTRGIILLVVGSLVLFVMDSDASVELNHSESHRHQGGLNHVFYHILGWFGISDHKGGIVLLMLAIFLRIAYDHQFRHIGVEIGVKRLYAIQSVISTALLTPLGVLSLIFTSSFITSYATFILTLFMAATFVMVVDFYADSICFQNVRDPVLASARWSPITMFWCSLLISWLWYENVVGIGGHPISGGVIVTVLCFSCASFVLTSAKSQRFRAGHFAGLSDTGMPLYTAGEAFLQKTSKSVLNFCRETLAAILANSDSRRIFWFLCANLAFCGVEFFYGFWTNSLGLISDGFHMLFDCSALVMGLVASVMARWTASRHYSFGYGRVEVLSGFINALFLIVIAIFIFLEALERLYDPPDVSTDKLMFVAVAGLCVNLFGMYAFHGGDHGHSHGGESHTHSHGHSHGGGNANMQGVFLHVLADTLGSVFVIISTIMIQLFGWQWVDPFCSLVLSLLILGSVYPLLKSSASTLLQSVPDEMSAEMEHVLDEILNVEGVRSYSQFHVWQLKSEANVASIHIQTNDGVNAQLIRHKVHQLLKQFGATQISVQVEDETFFRRIQTTCPSYRLPPRVDRGALVHSHKGSHGAHGHSHNGHSHESGHGHGHGHSH